MFRHTPDFIDSIIKGFASILGASHTWEIVGRVLAFSTITIGALLIVFVVVALISAILDRMS